MNKNYIYASIEIHLNLEIKSARIKIPPEPIRVETPPDIKLASLRKTHRTKARLMENNCPKIRIHNQVYKRDQNYKYYYNVYFCLIYYLILRSETDSDIFRK